MDKGQKIILGSIVACAALTCGVVGSVVKPVVQYRDVPRVVIVTPTASPSATLAPVRGRSLNVTKPAVTVTPVRK